MAQTCKRPRCSVIVPGGDKVHESLSLLAKRGLEEVGVITERLDGAGGDKLCGTAALHLTGQEADGGR